MMRIGCVRDAKPGDEIAGEFTGHLFVMKIDHMVYSTLDVTDDVEEYLRTHQLTEPELILNTEENGLGKWRFDQVSEGTVLLIGRRLDLWLKDDSAQGFTHGYVRQNDLVMIHTPI